MKTQKLLLFKIFLIMMAMPLIKGNRVMAQDTIPKLIISEYNGSYDSRIYIELTNIGDTALNLSKFGIGSMQFWRDPYEQFWKFYHQIPEYLLEPGETFLIARVNDWYENYEDPKTYEGSLLNFTPKDIWANVDWEIHKTENPTALHDSAMTPAETILDGNSGIAGYFIDFNSPKGQIVVDAVNNALDEDGEPTKWTSDVAGILGATFGNILVRKTSVVRGNLDWEQARGIDAEDSEWIVLPFPSDYANPYQKHFTTIKHHGDVNLDASSLSSSTINIDFDNAVMDVPWGIYRDSIMFEFELGKGLAWNYVRLGTIKDSTYLSTRTGDTLIMWAMGPSLKEIKFHINTLEPAENMNHVVPRTKRCWEENESGQMELVYNKLFDVTEDQPGMDTINDVAFGLRVDTLFAYLEKPSNAEWEIVWVDNEARPDLKYGDILRVTAENGDVKDYFIAAFEVPEPSENANLSAIIWPDIPELTKMSPEWGGDITIPMFASSITSYQLMVPYGQGIPALKAVPEDLNAKIDVKRATNLSGTVEERTTVFTVTAENGTEQEYSVLFTKEVPSIYMQPYTAEPIVSQLVFRQDNRMNFLEIANVGNQPLDMSNYLITSHSDGMLTSPADAITYRADEFLFRYYKYVYGYDYVKTEEEWAGKTGFLELQSYDAIIEPGDVLVFGNFKERTYETAWQAGECDILFEVGPYDYAEFASTIKKIHDDDTLGLPKNSHMIYREGGVFKDPVHIFRILNDSILEGKKGVTDPSDFQLVEAVGGYAGETWIIDGNYEIAKNHQTMIRKEKFWRPDTLGTRGFDTIPEKNYWYYMDRDSLERLGYSNRNEMLADGIGTHVFDPVTAYKSTITSQNYLVSEGYTSPQTIDAVISNTSVEDFLNNLIKADTGQVLDVKSGSTGDILGSDATVAEDDTLVVISADGKNITKYAVIINDAGLDDNAVLEAKDGSGYEISIDGSEGTISGIAMGSSIQTVVDNVIKPTTARMYVIDQNDALVSLTTVRPDGEAVETQATHLIAFEVVAQDNVTKIVYNLEVGTSSDALLFSDMYAVDSDLRIVSGVPTGTRVSALFTYLHASPGASVVLYDKAGNERTMGEVAYDDIILVTSADESTVNTYYLQFLEEKAGTDAYVLSNILPVDQLTMMIGSVQEGTAISELAGMLTPAPGASMMIVDADGNEVSSGEVADGQRVKVTSGDGALTVYYDLDIVVGVQNLNLEGISVYPNPTEGELFIIGLRENAIVKVHNIHGQVVKVFQSDQINGGRISIEDQKSGLYFITVNSGNYVLKALQVVRK